MRLQAARLRPLHLLSNFGDRAEVHTLRGELSFGDEFFDRVDIDRTVDLPEKFSFYLRSVAVADSVDEEVAQSVPFEQFAEHIVDLAAKRRPRLLQLFEQPPINLALAGVCGA